MCNFLGGSNSDAKRYHLLVSPKVCVPVDMRGLGIRRISEINSALLCKWIWNLGIANGRLWKEAIRDKYGPNNGGCYTVKTMPTHGSRLWKGINTNLETVMKHTG